jgi:3'-phosphoadenosine 5'-phosphosulfate sulfotransferase (PAPS reductase)/FAD synthetase
MDHLDRLEAESVYIMRETVAECEHPVMLYSIGKDSSVMLHLAQKAFYPEKPPFPFLHVNTTYNLFKIGVHTTVKLYLAADCLYSKPCYSYLRHYPSTSLR